MKMRVLLVLAMASASAGASAQNLLVNGGFELGPRGPAGVLNIPAGSNLLPGWTVKGAGVDLVSAPAWGGSQGSAASVDLSLLSAGSISQTVQTAYATQYRLKFDISASPDPTPPNKDMRVVISNGAQQINQTYSPTSSGIPNKVNWDSQTLNFKSFSPITTVSFESMTNSAFGPNVDSVSLEAVGIWARFFQLTGRNSGMKFNFTVPQIAPPLPPPPPPVIVVPERPRLRIPARVTTIVLPSGPIKPPNETAKLVVDVGTTIITYALGKGIRTPKGFQDPEPPKTTTAGSLSSDAASFAVADPDDQDGYAQLIELDLSILTAGDFDTMLWKDGDFVLKGTYIGDEGTFTDDFDVTSTLKLAPLNAFAVPEPANWAMLIAGFGLTGAVLRRRRRTSAIAV